MKSAAVFGAVVILVIAICFWSASFFGQGTFWCGTSDEDAAIERTGPTSAVSEKSVENEGKSGSGEEKIRILPSADMVALVGRVLSRDRCEPLDQAGVEVFLIDEAAPARGFRGKTDEDGTFCITIAEKIQDETFFYIDVTADGFIKDSREVVSCIGARVLNCGTFCLESDRAYCLRVTTGDGAPLYNAAVTFYWDLTRRPVVERYSNHEGEVVFGDSDVLGGVCGLTNVYLKAVMEGYAPYFGKLMRGSVLLSEIVMEEEGYWRGRVIDDSTEEGVEGASISLRTTVVPWQEVKKSVTANTDKSGSFVLRRMSFDLEDFTLVVSAKGYNNCYPNWDELAGIRLKPLQGESISGRIVNAVTECPLGQQVVTVNGREMRTGYDGEFTCIVNKNDWDYVRISARGFKTEEYPLPGADERYAGMLEARLYPVIQDSFSVKVVNAIGESIPGAFVKIRYWQTEPPFENGQTRISNGAGKAIFDLPITAIAQGRMEVEGKGYCALKTGVFSINDYAKRAYRIVMKKGVSIQNIYVVDDNGNGSAGRLMEITVEDDSGEVLRESLVSDAAGRCMVNVPPFMTGFVSVADRPDRRVDFTLEDVLSEKIITVVVTEEKDESSYVEGLVVDESGQGIRGVNLQLKDGVSGEIVGSCASKEKGVFALPVVKGRSLCLCVCPTKMGGQWYFSDSIYQITGGERLTVGVLRRNGIKVDTNSILRRFKHHGVVDYDIYFVKEDGSYAYSEKVVQDETFWLFLGLPAGKYEFVMEIETGEGKMWQTEEFRLPQRESLDLPN